MVEVNPPEFLGAECYTFEDFRQAFNGVVCVEGVTATGDLLVTAAGGASVNVNVAAGTAWVEGNINGAKGMYYVENGASVAVTIAANGAGSSRIDLILATVYDSQYIGSADQWAIEVVQGVAGAGVPAVPASTRAGYLILGHVTVPASGGTPSVVSNLAAVITMCGARPENLVGAYRLVTAQNVFTNPNTNTVFPQAADRTALTTTLVKVSASSKLEVHFSLNITETSGGLGSVDYVGIRIGGTDYDISSLSGTSNDTITHSGHRIITGVAAGSLTIEPYVRSTGTITLTMEAGYDTCSYTVREVF